MPNITIHPLAEAPSSAIKMQAKHPLWEKVSRIALEVLLIGGMAALTYALPIISIGLNALFYGAYHIIRDGNSDAIAKKELGVTHSMCKDMIKSIAATKTLNKIRTHVTTAHVLLLAFSPIPIPYLAMLTLFYLWDWSGGEARVDDFNQKLRQTDDAFKSRSEQNAIKRLFPTLNSKALYKKCQQERDNRETKSKYLTLQKKWMSQAWERLLKKERFSISQGLEGDPDIFLPLSHMCVLVELQDSGAKIDGPVPPTLAERMRKVETARKAYKALPSYQKEQVQDILLGTEKNKEPAANKVFLQVGSLATPLLQEQDVFEDPLLKGAEQYCLNEKKVTQYLKIQKNKLTRYKKTLFMEAE